MVDTLRFQIAGSLNHAFLAVHVLREYQVQLAIWHASQALTALHQPQQHLAADTFRRARHQKPSMTHFKAAIQHVIALTRQENLSRAEREKLLLASLLLMAPNTRQGGRRRRSCTLAAAFSFPVAVLEASSCVGDAPC